MRSSLKIEAHPSYHKPGSGDKADAWKNGASCLNRDPNIFFPAPRKSTEAARAICSRCVVREDCLELAFTEVPEVGIWGGFDVSEIEVMRRVLAGMAAKGEFLPLPQTFDLLTDELGGNQAAGQANSGVNVRPDVK